MRRGVEGLALGVDISEPMLARAVRNEAGPQVGFIKADAQRLPLRDNTIDVAISTAVLQLVPDPSAALAEIAGCFAFWAWWRLDKSILWLVPGMASLALFGWLLTQADSAFAGRAYAAYGGVYIAASLLWLWLAEGLRPDRFDLAGAGLAIAGAVVILAAPR